MWRIWHAELYMVRSIYMYTYVRMFCMPRCAYPCGTFNCTKITLLLKWVHTYTYNIHTIRWVTFAERTVSMYFAFSSTHLTPATRKIRPTPSGTHTHHHHTPSMLFANVRFDIHVRKRAVQAYICSILVGKTLTPDWRAAKKGIRFSCIMLSFLYHWFN